MRKIFTFFLALAASVGTMFAVSGTCGANLTWDLTNGVLTISGTGDMTSFPYEGAPWYSYRLSIKEVSIENSVTSIGDSAFADCSGLTSITIPNSVTSIGSHAFAYCTGLTSVTIPNSVTSIGNSAFDYCTGLTSVTIPNSVTSIGKSAFWACTGLTSVTIPNSVTCIGYGAFADCSGLPVIDNIRYADTYLVEVVDKNLSAYTIKEGTKWIGSDAFKDCTGLTSVTIPNSVTSIGYGAFSGCTGLTSVTIGNSVTSIGDFAFDNCTGLTSVTIPNSVTSIGERAFRDCTGLTSVTIPNSVTSIGGDAFAYCSALTSVTIGNSVTSIGYGAFDYCTGLTKITCEAVTPPSCGEGVFNNVEKSIPLYVPAGTLDDYKAADQWKDFGNNIKPIQAPESSVTDLQAEPTNNSVTIEWPAVSEAAIYTIEIKKNGELICTLSFNEQGQLLNISFAAPSRQGNNQAPRALQTATGWQYTINGLDPNTDYTYTVIAKKNESDTTPLFTKTISFKTKDTETALESVTNDQLPISNKIIRDNQILILRDGKTYTITGAEVIVQ